LLTLGLCALLLSGPAALARAAGDDSKPPPKCFVPDQYDNLPECTQTANGHWTVTYPDDIFDQPDVGSGIPGGFLALMVLAAVGGLAFTVWKVGMARDMASEAGMDPNRATAVTLLSDDGLDATYIASSLRRNAQAVPPPTPAPRTTAERLRDLQQLRDDGLVTADEYEARRRSILDSV
jgi:hypothetical protein